MKKKKGISKEFAIGLFVVIVIVGGYFGFNFLKNRNVFSGDYFLNTTFTQADGLENGAGVIIKGYKVGSVEKITLDMATQELNVILNIGGDYELPKNSTAKIVSSSLLGGKVVEITIGTVGEPILEDGDTITASQERGLMDSVGEEYAEIKESLDVIVEKVNITLDGVNRALCQENTAALQSTLANIESATKDLKKITNSQSANIQKTLKNLSTLSESLSNAAPELERSINNIAVISDTLKVNAPSLIASATNSVKDLENILSKINGGEGTMGKLVTDEELYANLNQTLENLSLLVIDLQENPKKYINVKVF